VKSFAVIFALALALGALSGCNEVELETKDEQRYSIVSHSGMAQPILLDQESGKTWRLTDEGWEPIQAFSKKGKAIDWDDVDD